jgi:hypothetical protein
MDAYQYMMSNQPDKLDVGLGLLRHRTSSNPAFEDRRLRGDRRLHKSPDLISTDRPRPTPRPRPERDRG